MSSSTSDPSINSSNMDEASKNSVLTSPNSLAINDGDSQSQLSSFSEPGPENGPSPCGKSVTKTFQDKNISVKILRRPPNTTVPKFALHDCSPICLEEEKRIKEIKGVKVLSHCILINRVNPYCVPIFMGWHRTKSDGMILYTAPCGKQLNSIRQVYQYLLRTESGLSIDQFSFHSQLKLHTSREPFKAYSYVSDIANGKEILPIACINELDPSSPEEFVYISESIAGPNVNLDCDPDFLSFCVCQDRCKNCDECSCHGLSKEEAYMVSGGDSVNQAGFKYKCLNKKLVSAVFECNANCKCDIRCLNRVTQNGMKHCLQVFKTENRGWGLRCLHDIPPGSFISLYAGEIIDFDTVNEESRINDYIAALDYIEAGRRPKRDFDTASDIDSVLDSDSSSSEELSSCEGISNSSIIDDLSDFEGERADVLSKDQNLNSNDVEIESTNKSPIQPNSSSMNGCKNLPNDSSKRSHETEEQDDLNKRTKNEDSTVPVIDLEDELIAEVLESQGLDSEDVIIDFDSMDQSKISSSREGTNGDTVASNHGDIDDNVSDNESLASESKPSIIHKHLDMKHSFSVDGARYGNVGRFLNHSCEPNCRIRNIFVNNHDYRFPQLAFFSTRLIKAYEELTWDYRYPTHIKYADSKECLCGSPVCRGRIY
ncbi:histone-lysine N-methyltransferase SETDB1 [Tetranychus urticae]|uniref:Histone-lysine N-methyltransferase n=1 Tax=Tetranychus urticae TaxID=32264 RepID=T1KZH8_TETUR|nr:histone-lysine N-methyltransferase SETDB1 [Tetranychus urticae]